MKKEDIEFLMELQHELKTQKNDGNAMTAYRNCELERLLKILKETDFSLFTVDEEPVQKLYKCQVCGRYIPDNDGITTINGWWVCDNDSCRSLNEDLQAVEKIDDISKCFVLPEYEDVLKKLNIPDSDGIKHAYKTAQHLFDERKSWKPGIPLMPYYFDSQEDIYRWLEKSERDFKWIDELDIGGGRTLVNTCKTVITDDEAKRIIHDWFGFEIEQIEICGPAYYEATDWNFIRFVVRGYSRCLWNDGLYDILR